LALKTLTKMWTQLRQIGPVTLSVVYVCVLVGLPLVDAAIEAATRENETHIESESAGFHSLVHDEYLCQSCRLIEISGDDAAVSRFPFEEASHHRDAVPAFAVRRGRAPPTALIPRAPPSL